MANEYAVNRNDLTNIAEAIREKAGTEEHFVFPDGFISAIEDIKGGGGLNFEVVGGSEPSKPKENTIWVDTGTAITGWILSATEPESAAAGTVWIKLSASSDIEFSAFDDEKNVILLRLDSAAQMIGGAWETREASIYINGSWKKPTSGLFILKDGKISEMAGSWLNASSTAFTGGEVVSAAQNMEAGNHGSFSSRVTISKSHKTLRFLINPTAIYSNLLRIGLSNASMAIGSYATNASKFIAFKDVTSLGEHWENVDVSNVIGDYYISVASVAAFTISEIVLTEGVYK